MSPVHRETGSVEGATPATIVRIRGGGWRGEFVGGTPLHEWLLKGGRPDQIPMPNESIVRDGSRSRCARISRLDGESPELPEPLFFKAYRRRPGAQAWLKRISGWHLPSWVWRTSWRLIEAGVPIARPYGYLVPRPFAFGKTSYFWSQWIEGAQSAKTLARNPETRSVVADNLQFAERSAGILAGLHNAGVYHRDMNWGNLLVEDSSDRVWLVDLDSAHRWTTDARGATHRDLARFLMDAEAYETSSEWRDRFLGGYAEMRAIPLRGLESQVQATIKEFYKRRVDKRRRKARQREHRSQV